MWSEVIPGEGMKGQSPQNESKGLRVNFGGTSLLLHIKRVGFFFLASVYLSPECLCQFFLNHFLTFGLGIMKEKVKKQHTIPPGRRQIQFSINWRALGEVMMRTAII